MDQNVYSLIIQPPENIFQIVSNYKKNLYQKIGDFKSFNNPAHITFCTFKATKLTLQNWDDHINKIVQSISKSTLMFSRTECFSNGAFVILPDENGFEILKKTIKMISTNKPKGKTNIANRAHLTIARNLTHENLLIAKSCIPEQAIQFEFDAIVLKKLNFETGSFEFQKKYELK